MSVFADYDLIAQYYDSQRKPNGAHQYLGIIYNLTGKTRENLHLLDMGCGTGNHTKFLLDQGLDKATIFDANPSMLKSASKKLDKYVQDGRVVVHQNKLPKLPYNDEMFDAVMCNQVLHHLTTLDDENHTLVSDTIKEAFRVLKPNGALIVNLCTPDQCSDGLWWLKLYPESLKATLARLIPPKVFLQILRSAGFCQEGLIVEPLDTIYNKAWNDRADGPLDPAWRNIDSAIASSSDKEVGTAIEFVRQLKDNGLLEDFFNNNDSRRESIGQFGIYYARKN